MTVIVPYSLRLKTRFFPHQTQPHQRHTWVLEALATTLPVLASITPSVYFRNH